MVCLGPIIHILLGIASLAAAVMSVTKTSFLYKLFGSHENVTSNNLQYGGVYFTERSGTERNKSHGTPEV